MISQRPKDVPAFAECRSIWKVNAGLKANVSHLGERLNGNLPYAQDSEFCKYLDFGERVDSVDVSATAHSLINITRSQLTILSNSK